jgi:hypothetical protein
VDRDDPIKQRDDDEDEKSQGEVVQERVEIDLLPGEKDAAGNHQGAQDNRRNHHLMADRVGFELAVRSHKFAFEFSAEFSTSFAKFSLRENFAPEVLDERVRLSLRSG